MDSRGVPAEYEPLTLARLGTAISGSDESRRWRLVAEFLEEYSWEPIQTRAHLLDEEPSPTGDERWDVFLAALAEHLAAGDHRGAPNWSAHRTLRRFWFPFSTRAARADALVNAPASFRRRGVPDPRSRRRATRSSLDAEFGHDDAGRQADTAAAGRPTGARPRRPD